MSRRALVAYASKAGSTVEVATAIGQVLAERGYQVIVQRIGEKPSLAGYAAAVIGSAIRMGNWLPEAAAYLRDNQAALSRIPVAIFTVHFLNTGDDQASRAARQAYTAPLRQWLAPQAEAFFAGKMDYRKLSFIDRTIARAVQRSTHTPPGDRRDWTAIRGWAQGILI